jgi:heme oxygenase
MRAYHAAADTQRLSVMEIGSTARYRTFLERVWGFESSVEMQASSIGGVELAAAGARLRIGRLYEDLIALGLTPVEIAGLPQAKVEIREAREAFGWLLVIERHVLLAGLIRRYLASQLREAVAGASRYFDTHRDAGRRVRELGDVIGDAIGQERAGVDAIIAAQRVAFETQHPWYSRTSRVRHATVTRAKPGRTVSDRPQPTQPRAA